MQDEVTQESPLTTVIGFEDVPCDLRDLRCTPDEVTPASPLTTVIGFAVPCDLRDLRWTPEITGEVASPFQWVVERPTEPRVVQHRRGCTKPGCFGQCMGRSTRTVRHNTQHMSYCSEKSIARHYCRAHNDACISCRSAPTRKTGKGSSPACGWWRESQCTRTRCPQSLLWTPAQCLHGLSHRFDGSRYSGESPSATLACFIKGDLFPFVRNTNLWLLYTDKSS